MSNLHAADVQLVVSVAVRLMPFAEAWVNGAVVWKGPPLRVRTFPVIEGVLIYGAKNVVLRLAPVTSAPEVTVTGRALLW